MSRPTILDRQTALLKYLSDPLAYGVDAGEGLLGPDKNIKRQGLLFLARGALARRANKVRTKLRVTVDALGDDFPRLMNEFAHHVPPNGLRGVEAAEQFHLFLEAHCQAELLKKPYLVDLCRLELAMARVARPEEELAYFSAVFTLREKPDEHYRVAAGCKSVKCAYDIRPLFDSSVSTEVVSREVLLGVFYVGAKLRVLEITPDIFSLVSLICTFKPGSVEIVQDHAAASVSALRHLNVIEAV